MLLLLLSCQVMSNSLRLRGLQHARLLCPSPTPGAYSNSCLLSRWCHATIFSNENGTPVFYIGRQLLYYWATREARLAFPKVPPDVKNWLTGKDPDARKEWRREAKWMTEDGGDCWMASPTGWTWVWVSSRSWWWTGRPGMLQSMGSQRVRHDWGTELNWAE